MGHVPITHISPEYLQRLESIDVEADSDDEKGDQSETAEDLVMKDAVPTLDDIFSVGQYLRAVVTALLAAGETSTVNLGKTRDDAEKASKRIELSLFPERLNSQIGVKDLAPGFVSGAWQNWNSELNLCIP